MKAPFAIATIVLALATPVDARDLNYVVIGAFAVRENAERLAETAKAQIDLNREKQLYYVFTMKTDDHAAALAEAIKIQQETSYTDAWVFVGSLVKDDVVETAVQQPAMDQPAPVIEQATPVAEQPNTNTALDPTVSTKDFFFKVMNADGVALNGAEITVVEPKSLRKEFVHKGNTDVTMKAINQSGAIRLECDLVGYRKIIQAINFKAPDSTEGVRIENNRIIVPFYLVRLKKGDHSILYNVFFYKDAAIMRPESKSDLDGLLAMMNENPGYKIRIHGHTNGSASGPILEAGDSGDLFALSGAKKGAGSAKKLSEKRGNVIRDYLVQNGVDPTRMSVKAWGGKKPIYDKHHTQASANVRVEVEVLEE